MEEYLWVISAPEWFIHEALVLRVFIGIVLLSMSMVAVRMYRMSEAKEKFRTLSYALLVLAAAFLLRATVDFALYLRFVELAVQEQAAFTVSRLEEALVFTGIALYRILILFGLGMVYTLHRPLDRKTAALGAFLLLMAVYASIGSFPAFHVVAALLALLITHNMVETYRRTRHPVTAILMVSFAAIALAQLLLAWKADEAFYLLGNVIQVLGYAGLLTTLYLIHSNGKIPITK